MLQRGFRKEESLARHWAGQVIELCLDIDDDTLVEYTKPIEEALKVLDRERRVVFIGDGKSGKSSLLAGVAQYPAIAKAEMKEDYHCWRYRSNDGDNTCSTFIPLENLEGLELTDTCAAEIEESRETILALMKSADVVIVVVDARKVESATIWDLVAKLPQERRSACLIAVTHTDKLAAEEALRIGDGLRDFCRKRLSSVPGVYLISPTTMKGMESFVQRVQEALNSQYGLRADIRKVLDLSGDLLNRQYHILRAREQVSQSDNNFLDSIDGEIDYFLSRQLTGIKNYTDAYADAAMQALPATLTKLNRGFGHWLSPVTLVRLHLYGPGTENYYYRMLCQEILSRQEVSDANFAASCAGHWNHVRPRMKKAMECEIGDFPEQDLSQELEKLRNRLGRELYKPFAQDKLRNHISQSFNRCVHWMQFSIFLICAFLIAAGVFGVLGQTETAVWMLAGTGAVWVVGSVMQMFESRRIRRDLVHLAEHLHERMLTSIGEDVKTLLISRVSAYRRLYTATRLKVARNEAMLKPLQHRHLIATRQISSILPR